MNTFGLLTAVGGGIAVVGLLAVIAGIYGQLPSESPFRSRITRVRVAGARSANRRRLSKYGLAVMVGLLIWLISGWPVGGLLVGFAVIGLPYFFAAGRIAARRIDRLEALEEWVRRLADSMSAGSAPVQTIVRSALHAPVPIQAEVTQLASRLSTPRLDRNQALRSFADDIDDSLGDMIVLALEIAVSSRASQRVPDVLRAMASEVADEVKARRKVETDRAEPRNEARTIVIIQLLFVVGVTVATSYANIYGTATGQAVLAVLGLVVVGALVMLRRLSLGDQPPRILAESRDRR